MESELVRRSTRTRTKQVNYSDYQNTYGMNDHEHQGWNATRVRRKLRRSTPTNLQKEQTTNDNGTCINDVDIKDLSTEVNDLKGVSPQLQTQFQLLTEKSETAIKAKSQETAALENQVSTLEAACALLSANSVAQDTVESHKFALSPSSRSFDE